MQIEYVFSDKTGTLTSNDMRLRQIAVKGLVYGSKDVALEEDAPHDNYHEAMDIFDPNMAEVGGVPRGSLVDSAMSYRQAA